MNALRLCTLAFAINQHIGESIRKAPHMLAIIDGETRHLVDHVQRRDRIEGAEIGRRKNQDSAVLGAGLGHCRARKQERGQTDGGRPFE